MDEIRVQVQKAHRRLLMQSFLRIFTWTLCACLFLAVAGLAIPKIWAIPVEPAVWQWSWIGGAIGLAFVLAGILTWWTARGVLDAAIELDHRFGLRERVSSSLTLTEQERQSEAGRALLEDAVRRVKRIDVRDEFRFSLADRSWLVLVPLLAVLVLMFVSNASPSKANAAGDAISQQLKDEMAKTADRVKKKIEEQKKQALHGLKEADLELIKKIEESLNELSQKGELQQKDALAKLNNLANEIQKRRDELGSGEEMKKQFERLKNLQQGPADKIADAMKDGDFRKAIEELNKLKQQVLDGKLTDEQKEQLAQQMKQLQEKLQNAVDAHEQAKRDLEDLIRQKRAQGDRQAAEQLQKKLNQLNQQNDAMQQMQKMANQMGQCSKCMKQGEMAQAGQQMQQMAEQMEQMQGELQQMQSLNEMLDEIADARQACAKCQGEGMEGMAMADGQMQELNQIPRRGPGGPGRGAGLRDIEEEDTSFYNSKVPAKARKGEAVITGDAYGPNRAGNSKESVKQLVEANLSEEAAPVTEQKLPKAQLEQTRQYFEQFNK